MKNFGKNLKVQPKKRVMNEKDTFIDLIDIFDNCNNRTEELEGNFMFNISLSQKLLTEGILIQVLNYLKSITWSSGSNFRRR